MLPEMIFAVEGSRFWTFLVTGGMIVRSQMLWTGIEFIAVYALGLASYLICDNLTKRCAKPFFE